MTRAYLLVHGTVVEVTHLTQTHGVVNSLGPSRAEIDVAFAYDQSFSGTLHVDFNLSGSNCEIGILPVGIERDFIVFKNDQNVLYLPDRCVDLTPKTWEELRMGRRH